MNEEIDDQTKEYEEKQLPKMRHMVEEGLKEFVANCGFCGAVESAVATCERYDDSLVFECVNCGEKFICGNQGRLTDAFKKIRGNTVALDESNEE